MAGQLSRAPSEPSEAEDAPQQVAKSSGQSQNHASGRRKSERGKRGGRSAFVGAAPRAQPARDDLGDASGRFDAEQN